MAQDRPGLGGLHATPTTSVDISVRQSIDIKIVIFSSHSADNVRRFSNLLYKIPVTFHTLHFYYSSITVVVN